MQVHAQQVYVSCGTQKDRALKRMVMDIYWSNCSIRKNDALVWSSMISDDGTIVNLRPKFDGLKVHISLMCFIYNVTVIGKK